MGKLENSKPTWISFTRLIPFIILLVSCSSSGSENVAKNHTDSLQTEPLRFIIEELPRKWNHSVRGLYQLDDSITWASGTNGSFMRCVDGIHWESDTVSGYTNLDFRDIHPFDESNALLMAAGEEGRILRTEDGGKSWTEVYTDLTDGVFLDGMDFDSENGYCIGDPIEGRPYILRSNDAGRIWTRLDPKTLGIAIPGEGSYAASGTTVTTKEGVILAAYGGDSLVRVLRSENSLEVWESFNVPMRKGEGCGIFSMAFMDSQYGLVVGGCYQDSLNSDGNFAWTEDSGRTWNKSLEGQPNGYRSCITYSPQHSVFVTCGRTGVDISYDQGKSWDLLSEEGYYTCSFNGKIGWLMGRNGRIARIVPIPS